MKPICLIVFLFLASPVYAFDEWTEADSWREVAWLFLQYADYKQTMNSVVKHPDQFSEITPWMPEHPSRKRVNMEFATGTILQIYLAVALPTKYEFCEESFNLRKIWQYGCIGFTGHNVLINFGVHF